MERIAALHGYVVKNVRADGNCMFHAISHYIGDQISTHPLIGEQKAKELRTQTVQYLESNDTTPHGEKYSSFLEDQMNDQNGDKWSQYLNLMKKQGTYGDELILRAISHHFRVLILVLSTESPKKFIKYNPDQPNEHTKTIHLGYMHENRHYVRLENKEKMHQQPSKNESSV
ncbi:OTUD3 [Mytilus coruscus]|uniref:OTUD3 n=1 Tax=Mytilus coruscus TaxID=42192 RepID=A0A6J8E246_MYTCO|nr:OTUD3 [Mytilus coruscus]